MFVRAIEPFVYGESHTVISPAEIYEDTHPAVRANPALFAEVAVEVADAEPSKKRTQK